VFDFVNTLVPLREAEFLRILQGVYEYVHPAAPHVPFDAFVQHYVHIRDEQYARNLPELRENDFYERMATLWRRLTATPPNPKRVYDMMMHYALACEKAVVPAPYLILCCVSSHNGTCWRCFPTTHTPRVYTGY